MLFFHTFLAHLHREPWVLVCGNSDLYSITERLALKFSVSIVFLSLVLLDLSGYV